MMKRVISGLFLLIALGALGFIIAGALKSGEQLIVRFLTAVIVTALGLYVISDLRLKADDSAVAKGERTAGGSRHTSAGADHGSAQSTAAYMATVTRRNPAVSPEGDSPLSVTDLTADPLGTADFWGDKAGADDIFASGRSVAPSRAGARNADRPEVAKADERMLRVVSRSIEAEIDDSLSPDYQLQDDEVRQWPLTAEHPVVRLPAAAGATAPAGDEAGARVEDDITRPLATRRKVLAGEGRDGDLGADKPGVFDTGEIEKLVDQLASGGPAAPAPVAGSSPFGRLNPSGGLGLLERPSVDVAASPAPAPAAVATPDAGPVPAAPIPPVARPAEKPAVAPPEKPVAPAGPAVVAPTPFRPIRPNAPAPGAAPVASTLAAADYTRAPLAGVVDLRPRRIAPPNAIEAAIRSGELDVIASLIDQGLLSTEGPISDRDVRTMVYVAFTSSELRKILLAGGTLDGDNSSLDLGEVDVFYQPALAGGPSLSQPPAEPIDGEPSAAPALPVEVIDLRDAEPARARAL